VTQSRPERQSLPAQAGRGARIAISVAAVAVAGFLILEVANALGDWAGGTWTWKRPLSVAMAVAASVAVLVSLRASDRDRRALRTILDRLRDSEEQHAGITSIAVDSIITIDEQQRILLFNHGAETTFGWSAGDAVGQSLSVLLPARLHEVHAHHIARFGSGADVARRMGQRQAIVGLRRDGTEFPAEASISRLDLPGRRLFTVVLRDVTERHRQQQDERFLAGAGAALSASLDYESTLLSAVHLPIPHLSDCCVLDLITDDRTTRRIASVHDDPDRTRALRALAHRQEPAGNWPFPVATVLASQEPVVVDDPTWPRHDDGDELRTDALARIGITSYTSLPLVARGRLVGVLTLICTERTRNIDADRARVAESVSKLVALAIDNAGLYRQAQRATVARDEVLGAVSHDLRNPLAAIMMCSRVLAANNPATTNRDELIEAIIESAAMMQRMIQDLLDVATMDSGHFRVDPSPERVEALLERVLEMMSSAASERQVAIDGRLPASLPNILVDSTRFVQVLANLVSNAVKFSESGGTVSVTAEGDADEVVVRVTDTGVGIPAHHLPHVFDRHWHSRHSGRAVGTGLGLAIAQGIVEAHGGRIWVDSTEGSGSTFSFTVPIAREPASSHP
jgi:PAS domain S-box-containing protein